MLEKGGYFTLSNNENEGYNILSAWWQSPDHDMHSWVHSCTVGYAIACFSITWIRSCLEISQINTVHMVKSVQLHICLYNCVSWRCENVVLTPIPRYWLKWNILACILMSSLPGFRHWWMQAKCYSFSNLYSRFFLTLPHRIFKCTISISLIAVRLGEKISHDLVKLTSVLKVCIVPQQALANSSWQIHNMIFCFLVSLLWGLVFAFL